MPGSLETRVDPNDPALQDPAAQELEMTPRPEDKPQPGHQERTLTREERRDLALDDTFPASDPVPPSRIDGPNT